MDVVGVWKVKYIKYMLGDEAGKMQDIQELYDNGDEERRHDIGEFLRMRYIFCENGELMEAMVIPEGTPSEEIDKAVQKLGFRVIDGKYLAKDTKKYTEVEGGYKTDSSGISGFSEKDIDAINTIKVVDNMLEINGIFSMLYMVKES